MTEHSQGRSSSNEVEESHVSTDTIPASGSSARLSNEILEPETASSRERNLSNLAVDRGYATTEQMHAALRQYHDSPCSESFSTFLLRARILSSEQMRALERAQRGTSVIGGFEILEKVGQGGMGAVFRARQLSMERVVAMKILPPKLAKNPDFKQRFLNEARTCAKLSHLNIISGIDCGESSGYTYFAMEFVDGKTIKQLMKQKPNNTFLPQEAWMVIRQIADALVYARQMNIVHRDIKPDNIMVTKSGVAKLCDLGLAKQSQSIEESTLPLTSLAIGTPHYIAPEQAKGEKNVDYRSDLYSLGVTFYHMLVGKTPFDAPTSAAVMVHHISSSAKSPCELDTLIPFGYGYVITKLMAKNPLDRYQSSEELIEDLETIKNGNPPKAATFVGKSSCLAPTTTENLPRKTGKTTGPHPSVITTKQTTQITTSLKTAFLSSRLLAPQMQPVWIATIAIGILVIVAVGICFILK